MRKEKELTAQDHRFPTTTDFDIQKRKKLGIPLTRKQLKAEKQRKATPPTAESYHRKRSTPSVVRYDATGHCVIASKAFFDEE